MKTTLDKGFLRRMKRKLFMREGQIYTKPHIFRLFNRLQCIKKLHKTIDFLWLYYLHFELEVEVNRC